MRQIDWRRGRFLFQFVGLVHRPQGSQGLIAIDQRRDLNLAGRDHLDIDVLPSQSAEHFIGDARLTGHSQSDYRDFRHLIVMRNLADTHQVGRFANRLQRSFQFAARNGEGNVGFAFFAHVLHDHIDGDPAIGQPRKDFQTGTRHVGHSDQRDARFAGGHRRAANRLVAPFRFSDNHGAERVAQTAPHVNGDRVFLGEFDRAIVHHTRAEAGQLEHLVVADPRHAACFG